MVDIFLFPGQGAQFAGMGKGLLRANSRTEERLERISGRLGRDLGKILAEGPEEALKETAVSQPAITLVSLTALEALEERGREPAACAGFSLGEYGALAAAGVLDREEALDLVTDRGLVMDRVCRRLSDAGMAAVIGLPPERVENLVENSGAAELFAVNLNSPRQTVVAGTSAALAEAEGLFREAGAKRFVPLKVAGPFHSPLMGEAAEAFRERVAAVTWRDPQVPVYSNVTGRPVESGREAAGLAVEQIVSPVRWTDVEAGLLAAAAAAGAAAAGGSGAEAGAGAGGMEALEVGPGKVLAGLWKAVSREIPCRRAGSLEEIAALAGGNDEGGCHGL